MPAIGLPAGAPERPAEPVPYPAVHDMPPPRNSTPLNLTEQEQMERDVGHRPRRPAGRRPACETQAKKKAKAAAAKRQGHPGRPAAAASIY